MPAVYGPYYTLAEACDVLAMRESELVHAVESNQFMPVVHTKSQRVLAIARNSAGQIIVYGSCMYRGPLKLHAQYILQLLDGSELRLGGGIGMVLEETGISEWSSVYPFKRQPPHSPEIIWQSRECDQMRAMGFGVTPMPIEFQSTASVISSALLKIADSSPSIANAMKEQPGLQNLTPLGVETLQLNFNTGLIFGRDDLRIPASQIDRYHAVKRSQELIASEQRDNQLHELILRIIKANPGATAKQVWSLIDKDFNCGDSTYDKDGIIRVIDANSIDWLSRHGGESSIKWSSFQTQVSRIKKQYALNK